MLFTSFTALLALAGLSSAATTKRATVSTTLFAYGAGTNGAPVFYSDGLAYIGQTGFASPNGTQTNITFAIDRTSTTTPWPITANSTSVTFNSTLDLYIVPTNGTFTQVGFAANSSVPTGGVTTGFGWYGKSVAYAASDSDYQLRFWATNTTTTGIYALYWNDNTATSDTPEGAFPVAIKSTPPPTV
ncbi:hypothetical protein LHYA1_G001017 [Lachnellula hyalina]|uniref:Uncharacterized protein n=1 Tax=Lachnellula hyalina TaxID=1316788 RepID=A0A8H8R6U2_9HELO|nr:uncharacterized protein LHYA1_G001017 [Lachnellula hyalina]TVY29639.1 hypothetical protein LHYA1_G001017 [Lachnellula hyalina]